MLAGSSDMMFECDIDEADAAASNCARQLASAAKLTALASAATQQSNGNGYASVTHVPSSDMLTSTSEISDSRAGAMRS